MKSVNLLRRHQHADRSRARLPAPHTFSTAPQPQLMESGPAPPVMPGRATSRWHFRTWHGLSTRARGLLVRLWRIGPCDQGRSLSIGLTARVDNPCHVRYGSNPPHSRHSRNPPEADKFALKAVAVTAYRRLSAFIGGFSCRYRSVVCRSPTVSFPACLCHRYTACAIMRPVMAPTAVSGF